MLHTKGEVSQAQDFNYVVCGLYRGSKFSLNSIQSSTVHEHKDIITNYIKAQLLQTQSRSTIYTRQKNNNSAKFFKCRLSTEKKTDYRRVIAE
jgi:hypothetical protein